MKGKASWFESAFRDNGAQLDFFSCKIFLPIYLFILHWKILFHAFQQDFEVLQGEEFSSDVDTDKLCTNTTTKLHLPCMTWEHPKKNFSSANRMYRRPLAFCSLSYTQNYVVLVQLLKKTDFRGQCEKYRNSCLPCRY